jgi:hypothetical protein
LLLLLLRLKSNKIKMDSRLRGNDGTGSFRSATTASGLLMRCHDDIAGF